MLKKFFTLTNIVLIITMLINTYASTKMANEAFEECGIYKYEDMPYGLNKEQQNLDLYIPEGITGDVNMILYIHGGAWSSMDKNENRPCLEDNAKRGYVSASVNYRFADEDDKATMDDILDDITSALLKIKIIGKKHNINIKKTMLDGGSAGAHISLLYAYSRYDESPIKPALVIAKCPVSDFNDMTLYDGSLHEMDLDKWYISSNTWEELLTYLTGKRITMKNIKRRKDYLAKISPINYINENTVPTLIVHGTNDTVLPYEGSVRLDAKLTQYGIDHEFITYKGAWHDLSEHSEQEGQQFNQAYSRLFNQYIANN